jgi:hypothetical protein
MADDNKPTGKGALAGRVKLRPSVIQEAMKSVPGQAPSRMPSAPASTPAPDAETAPAVSPPAAPVTPLESAATPEAATSPEYPAAAPEPVVPVAPTARPVASAPIPAVADASRRPGRPRKPEPTTPADNNSRSMVKLTNERALEIRQGLLHFLAQGQKQFINQFTDDALEFYLQHLYKTGKLPRPAASAPAESHV